MPPKTNSLIQLDTSDNIYPAGGLDLFFELVKNPLKTVRDFVFDTLHLQPSSWEFFDNTRTFNNIFASKKSDKQLFAFLEQKQAIQPSADPEFRDYIGIKIEGVDFDIVFIVNQHTGIIRA